MDPEELPVIFKYCDPACLGTNLEAEESRLYVILPSRCFADLRKAGSRRSRLFSLGLAFLTRYSSYKEDRIDFMPTLGENWDLPLFGIAGDGNIVVNCQNRKNGPDELATSPRGTKCGDFANSLLLGNSCYVPIIGYCL